MTIFLDNDLKHDFDIWTTCRAEYEKVEDWAGFDQAFSEYMGEEFSKPKKYTKKELETMIDETLCTKKKLSELSAGKDLIEHCDEKIKNYSTLLYNKEHVLTNQDHAYNAAYDLKMEKWSESSQFLRSLEIYEAMKKDLLNLYFSKIAINEGQ
jgi:hypothetical protein